jgi:nitrite reductase/ring-hydroxylating ferredoxin subunit
MAEAQKEESEQCRSGVPFLPGLSLNSLDDVVASRRGILSLLVAASMAFFLATVPFSWRFIGRREERFKKMAVGRVSDVLPGEARIFTYPGKDNPAPALLVHLKNGEWRAYEGTCTHLSCLVYWDPASERLICPCHNAAFAAETGAVLMGPPRYPLPQIDLSVEDDVVYAVGMKR